MSSDATGHDLRFLNALRAIAAIWVMLAHCVLWGGFRFRYPNPQLAVDVFMMLSGYLMMATMQPRVPHAFGSPGRVWLPFYIRRLFRIAPLYYVTLGVAALSASWFVQGYQVLFDLQPGTFGGAQSGFNPSLTDYSLTNLLLHVTFVFGLLPDRVFSTMTGDWSLALEMQFYLLFPVLLYATRKAGPVLAAAAVVLTSFAAWERFGERFIEPAPLPLLMQYFLVGMLLYRATRLQEGKLLGVIAVILVLDYRLYGRSIVYLIPFALTIYLLASPRWAHRPLLVKARRLLENRAFDIGADLSYGIYLTHGFFISASALTFFQWTAFQLLPDLVRLFLMAAFVASGTLVVSFVLHRVVELPGIQAGKVVVAALHRRLPGRSLAA
jgi:peptidoglycan/LPS O-acetylase OafA/YrhL